MNRRVVIITNQRCGCHMLKDALNSHPHLRLTGEAFGGKDRYDWEFGINPDVSSARAVQTIYAEFQGFILHRSHPVAALARCRDLLAHLVSDSHVRFIDLRRRNLLRRYLSYRVGKETGSFDVIEDEILPSVQILPEEAEADFLRTMDEYRATRRMLPDCRTITVYYEQLDLDAIVAFLGLDPHPIAARTPKRDRRPLIEAIENYPQLEQAWLHTPWSVFLDD